MDPAEIDKRRTAGLCSRARPQDSCSPFVPRRPLVPLYTDQESAELQAIRKSGRQDLNLRPPGPQPVVPEVAATSVAPSRPKHSGGNSKSLVPHWYPGPVLASRPKYLKQSLCRSFVRGERGDSNPRPPGPQPGALPTELRPPRVRGPQFSDRAPPARGLGRSVSRAAGVRRARGSRWATGRSSAPPPHARPPAGRPDPRRAVKRAGRRA